MNTIIITDLELGSVDGGGAGDTPCESSILEYNNFIINLLIIIFIVYNF